MVIKLLLSTGKEIELTKGEYEELKSALSELTYVTVSTPFIYPQKNPPAPIDWPVVTCQGEM